MNTLSPSSAQSFPAARGIVRTEGIETGLPLQHWRLHYQAARGIARTEGIETHSCSDRGQA